jgi:hypothetical protein
MNVVFASDSMRPRSPVSLYHNIWLNAIGSEVGIETSFGTIRNILLCPWTRVCLIAACAASGLTKGSVAGQQTVLPLFM